MAESYLSQGAPDPTPSARDEANPTPEDYGGGASSAQVNAAVQGVRQGGQMAALEQKFRADDAAVQGAYAQAAGYRNQLLYGQGGVLSQQGENALGAPEKFGPQMGQYLQKLNEGLTNDNQKAMFQRIARAQSDAFSDTMQRHVYQQTQALEDGKAKEAITASANDAVANYQDPSQVNMALNIQRSALIDFAGKHGLDATATANMVQGSVGKTHTDIIDRMLANGQDLAAKQYYQSLPDDAMLGEQRTAVEKALEMGNRMGETQRQSTAIFSEYGSDMKGALAAARKIQDPQVQEDTVRELKVRFGEAKDEQDARYEGMTKQAYNYVYQSGQMPPANVFSQLAPKDQEALVSYRKTLAEGNQPTTDWNVYYDAMNQASNSDTQQQFVKTNLMQFRNTLADAQFNKLVEMQNQLREKKGGSTDGPDLTGFRSVYGATATALKALNIDPNTPEAGQFMRQVDQESQAHFMQTNRMATPEDLQKITDRLSLQVATGARDWAGDVKNKPVFELGYNDIPAADMASIRAMLVSRKLQPTPDAVLTAYRNRFLMAPNAR